VVAPKGMGVRVPPWAPTIQLFFIAQGSCFVFCVVNCYTQHMQFSNDVLAQAAIFVLGVCGFLVARHIYKHKNNNQSPLVCPIKFDCHAVTHSDYSKLFGIPVEILGMFYYALISLAYLFLILTAGAVPATLVGFIILISLAAFLFSVYLIAVQIFILKKGCSWCIVSALICFLIFIFTATNYDFSFLTQIFIK
jgi:uncharacterized membrane protein